MKIVAYGCRTDETAYFEELKNSIDGLELITRKEHLDLKSIKWAEGADGVSITGICRADKKMLEKLASYGIKFLSTRTIGYNHIDLENAERVGIRCGNVSYSPYGVANYTVLLILASIRKFLHVMARSNVMDYSLAGVQGRELQNMTVGIIGMGRIGKAVARCLSGFGCRIIGYTRHPDEEAKVLAEMVSLEEVYANADIITLHMPATEDNFHMINEETIAKMKDGVYIINTARGELVKTIDLIDAIESGKVGGVAIDTFEHERNVIHKDHEFNIIQNREMLALKAYPNVIVSPHAAFYTDQASKDMVYESIYGLVNWIEGKENKHELRVR